MHHYDPLDWIHQWDDYEMMMYLRYEEADGEDGIYMQVLQKVKEDGAEAFQILYDRKLDEIPVYEEPKPGTEAWEDRVLRDYLNSHPTLVDDEKAYVRDRAAK